MSVAVKKWRNSAAVRIPAVVLEATQLEIDEEVDIREEAGRIVIQPVREKVYKLDDLVKGINRNNVHEAVDFASAGRQRGLVMARGYVPDSGDVVWLNFTPQAGQEQAGHRPALVVSPAAYNGKTSLMLCCPLTTRIRNHPFEVPLPGSPASVVLADQVKSVDWRARKAIRKGQAAPAELAEGWAKVRALIG